MNAFLESHEKRINSLYYNIEVWQMQSSSQLEGLSLNEVKFVINGLVKEVERLQEENDEFNEQPKPEYKTESVEKKSETDN